MVLFQWSYFIAVPKTIFLMITFSSNEPSGCHISFLSQASSHFPPGLKADGAEVVVGEKALEPAA